MKSRHVTAIWIGLMTLGSGLGLNLSPTAAWSQERPQSLGEIVRAVDSKFRCADRDVPAAVLWNVVTKRVSPSLLHQFASISEQTLLEIVLNLHEINQGVAENLIKIWHIANSLCKAPLCLAWDDAGDRVNGLSRDKIDAAIRHLPPAPQGLVRNGRPYEFNYRLEEYAGLLQARILNNDFYNFRVSALLFHEGLMDREVVYSSFARGKKDHPHMIAAGQDLAILVLQRLRFEERHIQHLKAKPELANMPEAFWDFLRKWRFKGEVRAVPVGTVVFKDEPILQIRTRDPISAQLVETIVTPIVNSMTTYVTNALGLIQAAGGRPVIEGATRRSHNGLMSSLAAMLAGAYMTSNSEVGRITGFADGGTWNHASTGHFGNEVLTFQAQDRLTQGVPKLADTYSILHGVRNAVRASGPALKGVRLDSNLPGMDKKGTTEKVRELLVELGLPRLNITYSDGLDKPELKTLEGVDFQFALIGTEFGAPKGIQGVGMVYKLVQFRDGTSHEVQYPVKASTGKPSVPGATQYYRSYRTDANGVRRMAGDVMALEAGPDPENARPMLQYAMIDGELVPGWLKDPKDVVAVIQQEVASLPEASEIPNYQLRLESSLARLTAARQEAVRPVDPKAKVGIIVSDLSNLSSSLLQQWRQTQVLLDISDVRVVPMLRTQAAQGDRTQSLATLHARAALLRQMVAGEKSESGGFVIESPVKDDDLADAILDRTARENRNVIVIAAETVYKDVLLPEILNQPESAKIPVQWEILSEFGSLNGRFQIQLDPKSGFSQHGPYLALGLPFGPGASQRSQIESLSPVTRAPFAAGLLSLYDHLPYTFIVHATDPQWTFEDASVLPEGDQTVNGTLSVSGTARTRDAIGRILEAAQRTGAARISLSKDAHLPIERLDPKHNGEFHPSGTPGTPEFFPGFPEHGMKGKAGPEGDRFTVNVEAWLKRQQVEWVPAHREVLDAQGNPIGLEKPPYTLNPYATKKVFVFEKNGPGAYSVFANPHFEAYMQHVDPEKILPQFHFGWCTDFCDRAALEGLWNRGYRHLYFIVDAAAGVIPNLTQETLVWMNERGIQIITTAEFEALAEQWAAVKTSQGRLTLATVLNDLHSLKLNSKTHDWVVRLASQGRWTNESRVPKQCEAHFQAP